MSVPLPMSPVVSSHDVNIKVASMRLAKYFSFIFKID